MNDASLSPGNLWLAQVLWELGGVQFGSFTMGRSTVDSPVYVNPRLLVSKPEALKRSARLIDEELQALRAMRHPGVQDYSVVAGVPFGGLHLAAAFSLGQNIPMVYRYPGSGDDAPQIEGRYELGQSVLVMDDIISTGGSIIETTESLREAGLLVTDAVVLIDRQLGARNRLRQHGINLISILGVEQLLTYLLSTGKISQESYRRAMDYFATTRAE
ncbi:MAG TPA: phosphoribosyltransferase family protein [Dehalococcoidia bacterium]|nr:phosphoribosyltransferase family protein [Dehalococcoidia bacterium]